MYTLASKFGANVYIILLFTLATTYTSTLKPTCQVTLIFCPFCQFPEIHEKLFSSIFMNNLKLNYSAGTYYTLYTTMIFSDLVFLIFEISISEFKE